MAGQVVMPRIFLSASVPDPRRHPQYYETADLTAIRDAVRSLATVVLPEGVLVWGGHPAITPMIRVVAASLGASVQEHVWLFQSELFREVAPSDNEVFERVTWVPKVDEDREQSLQKMRRAMLQCGPFKAGVFLGGMEGVEEEFQMFREMHPEASLLPVASTGAAALRIFEAEPGHFPPELLEDYAYLSLFRRLL